MLPITVNPEATYATKGNVLFPGSTAQATAANATAKAALESRLGPGVTVTGLSVKTA